MGEQVLNTRVSLNKNKREGTDARRVSLPAFSSDLGKEVPNYLRASIGSCHDFCKYGKETVLVRQNRPWVKNPTPASDAVMNKAVPKINASKTQIMKKGKSEILSKAKFSEDSNSSENDIKSSKDFATSSELKVLKGKSLAKKICSTSGAKKAEKVKRAVHTNVGSTASGNKSNAKMENKSSVGRKQDVIPKQQTNPPMKFNAITRPPLSPSPSNLAIKAKTPSSSTPSPLTPVAKSRLHSDPNMSEAKSGKAHSPSSSASIKMKDITAKRLLPLATRNANAKKKLHFKDQSVKKVEAYKVQASKPVVTRRGSTHIKSKSATNLKGKELQLDKRVDAEIYEAKGLHEKKEETSHDAAELGNQEVMESYEEVPEKILYVIEMETLASLSPKTSPTHSSMTSHHEAGKYELTNADKASSSTEEETQDMELLASSSAVFKPSSPSSITISSHYEASQDDSAYTDSEADFFTHEDDHLVEEESLKVAEKTKLKKFATVSSQDLSNDPVKLKFRRGRVIDITQENNVPRRLKFRREHVIHENTANAEVYKNSMKNPEGTKDNVSTEESSGRVVLRHQDVQDKKDAQGLFNNVIEETASKLVETRKSKVKALVGAFETVISLQDGKPATS